MTSKICQNSSEANVERLVQVSANLAMTVLYMSSYVLVYVCMYVCIDVLMYDYIYVLFVCWV